MIFNYVLGIKETDKTHVKIIKREAVRAIILNNDNILMVKSNRGDYKFPGGGMEEGKVMRRLWCEKLKKKQDI